MTYWPQMSRGPISCRGVGQALRAQRVIGVSARDGSTVLRDSSKGQRVAPAGAWQPSQPDLLRQN